MELEDATQRTALHHAARGGHVEVAELLLDAGSRIDPVDGDRRTPLHHTSRSDEFFNLTKLLLDRGADFELEDVIGFLFWVVLVNIFEHFPAEIWDELEKLTILAETKPLYL